MTNRPKSFAVIQQGRADAERVKEILRLPDDMWSDVQVHFGMDEIGTAVVTLLLTGEQLCDLAEVAYKRNTTGDCCDDDAGYAHSDSLEVE